MHFHCFSFLIPCKHSHHFHSLTHAHSSPTLQADRQSRQCPGIATPCKAGGRQQRRESIHESGSNKPAGRSQPAVQGSTLASLACLQLARPVLSHSLTLLSHHSLRTPPLRLEPACQCLFSFAGSQQSCSLSFAQILFLTVGPLHCRPASYRLRLEHHRSCLPSLPACFAPKTESDTTAFPWHHSDCQAPTLSSALHHHHPCAAAQVSLAPPGINLPGPSL